MITKAFRATIAAFVVAVMFTGMSGAAGAAEDSAAGSRGEGIPPEVSQEVWDSLPAIIRNDPNTVIDPEYKPGDLIVYPDGTLVPGQEVSQAAAAFFCGGVVYGPWYGGWGNLSTSNCAIWGSPGAYAIYNWAQAPGVDTSDASRSVAS